MVLKRIALIALAACGSHEDPECAKITAKVRPVIEAMSRGSAGDLYAAFCEPPRTPDEHQLRACILDAPTTSAVETCIATAVDKIGGYQAKLAGSYLHAHADSDEAAAIDAGVSIALATVPELPVADPHGDKEVEVIVVDMPIDELGAGLLGSAPLLVRSASTKAIRGRVAASTPQVAALALFTAAGVSPRGVEDRGAGPNLDLRELGVSQLDALTTLARVMKTNIVARTLDPAPIDLVVSRRPVNGVLAALEALDGLVETRADYMIYLLPKGVALPALRAFPPGPPISLHVAGASARSASAALSAVAKVPHTCATTEISLHVEDVPPEEAVRAIEAASGATLDEAACSLPEVASADPATIVAIAIAGNQRVAVTAKGELVRPSAKLSIDLPSAKPAAPPASIKTFSAWRQRIVRTAAVIRIGERWQAYFELRDGTYMLLDPDRRTNMPPGLALTLVRIGPTGVSIADVMGRMHTISLAAK